MLCLASNLTMVTPWPNHPFRDFISSSEILDGMGGRAMGSKVWGWACSIGGLEKGTNLLERGDVIWLLTVWGRGGRASSVSG